MANRTCVQQCAQCGEDFAGYSTSKYCSSPCRNRAKYLSRKASGREASKNARTVERYNSDPEFRARILERCTRRARAQGVRPQKPGELRTCPVCSSDFDASLTQRYCSVPCRRKSAKQRADEREGKWAIIETIVGGCANTPAGRVNLPVTVVCAVARTGGLFVYCPNPNHGMGSRVMMSGRGDDVLYDRTCPHCGADVWLNREEVEWVIYERLSTARSTPTAA